MRPRKVMHERYYTATCRDCGRSWATAQNTAAALGARHAAAYGHTLEVTGFWHATFVGRPSEPDADGDTDTGGES